MKTLVKSRVYLVGFTIGLILFLVINFVDYKRKFDGLCMDCDNDFGLPFTIYQSGSFIHSTQILWIALFINIIIFSSLGLALGVLYKLVWSKYKIK